MAEKDSVEAVTAHLLQVGTASRSAMINSINSFVASPVGQVFARTIDHALEKSEEWLDYYLPLPEARVGERWVKMFTAGFVVVFAIFFECNIPHSTVIFK